MVDMMMLKSLLIVGIGSAIGWVTNYVAIKMLFKPQREVNLGLFKLQGVIPKRKHEIGIKIAETIKNQVINMSDIVKSLDKYTLEKELENLLDKMLRGKIKGEIVSNFPMAAMFLSDSVVEKITDSIKNMVLKNREEIITSLLTALENNVDFEKIIIKNVDNFSLDELEKITFSLAATEFRHIELIGAVLGALIGVIQVGVGYFIN